jgi:RNA polymerase sigma-70 factor (ECF subfamily)
MAPNGISDPELTLAAQAGDVAALGLLLARHQAGMRAVALSVLGHGPDVDDAVQDAALVALRRIGDVRDPGAVGPWLRMVVRNACRTRLRTAHDARFPDEPALPSTDATPEQALERHALRDWVWRAIEELPPPVRMAVMLRHFSSGVTSYREMAAACGVPVGTIRSRLSQGRAKMAEALLATTESAHDDAAELAAASRSEALETLEAAAQGRFATILADRWSPKVALLSGPRPIIGREFLLSGMEGDLEAGVRQHLAHVVASRDITIWEMDIVNPAENPEHCPPAVTWLMSLDEGRVHQLRLYHPQPSGRALYDPRPSGTA